MMGGSFFYGVRK